MSIEHGEIDPSFRGFKNGDTAEQFAALVAEAYNAGDRVIRIPFEDFTAPDAVVFGALTEVGGVKIRYVELLGGALEHFHGLNPSSWRAVDTPEAELMTPFSTSLELTFTEATEDETEAVPSV